MSGLLTLLWTVVIVGMSACGARVGANETAATIQFVNNNTLTGRTLTTNNTGFCGILFRELRPDAQDGSWGPSSITIPGFDHVALSYLDSVYESHPGYKNGPVYVSAGGIENRSIPVVNGVQNVHTIETFKHNSRNASTSPVINFKTIPIDNATALAMKNIITPKLQVNGFLAFNSVEEFVATNAPSAQKGGGGKYTGCGLIEWAAEQAGINSGQGFVPNDIESIATPNATFPLLSPEFMHSASQNQGIFFSTRYFLMGYFDRLDHSLTDPIGRRRGVFNRTFYNQIPNAFYSPNGDIETLVVVNPLPGTYKLTVYGILGKSGLASAAVVGQPATTVRTTGDVSVQELFVQVPEKLSSAPTRPPTIPPPVAPSPVAPTLVAPTLVAPTLVAPTLVAPTPVIPSSPTNNSGTSGILFRELRPDAQDGSWGPISIDIPGFDHVALSYLDSVYESHPGYNNGPAYVSAGGIENRTIPLVNGVQNVHTIETFKHNSRNASTSPVINFNMIPIDNGMALAMKNVITPKLQVNGFLAFNSVEEFVVTHDPSAQKGSSAKFTGVGIIEWAAEQAGVNNGQGFVPNDIESIATPNETFPLLSPELMYSVLQNQDIFFSTRYFLNGYFDPVDHLLTDPLGRKTGVVNQTQYREIPNAFSSPKGDVETLVVVNPLPGTYKLTVYGIPGKKGRASLAVLGRPTTSIRTNGDASLQDQLVQVPEQLDSRGDVNGDGAINQTDLVLLKRIISQAVVRYVRAADMDGNIQLNRDDVDILELYLNRITKAPTLSPNRAPVGNVPTPQARDPSKLPTLSPNRAPVTPPGSCPTTDKCNRGFILHRALFSRCIQHCTRRLLMRWRLRGKAWKCGKCQT